MILENNLFKKIKYIIATYLNKNPEYCWANLVLWAEGITPFWIVFNTLYMKNQICRKDVLLGIQGKSYCGKCDIVWKKQI